jgi:tetratricopeptide (TPR) repeat protein
MSERQEDEVPELDADTKSFLARHQQTGEPSPEALERVRAKLSGPSAPAPAPEAKLATVTRLPKRRAMFPPEVKAAAAVVALLLGAQAIYLAVRQREVVADDPYDVSQAYPKKAEVKVPPAAPAPPKPDPQRVAIAEAWRMGDFDGVRHLASKECSSAECGALSGELAEMLDLVTRVNELSEDERTRLGAFDQKLSEGHESALRRRLQEAAAPRPADSADALAQAKKLFDEAAMEKKAKNYERAVLRLEKCLKIAPSFHPCLRQLGSNYAAIATRDQSARAMEKAREAYERFVAVAPPDDEYVPKVMAILNAAKDDSTSQPYVSPRPSPETHSQAVLIKDGDLVKLGLGEQAVVTFGKPVHRIALGDTSIADVKPIDPPGKPDLLVLGYGLGKTTVVVWDGNSERSSFTIEVLGASRAEYETVKLVPGGHTVIALEKDIQRVAVGDPSIADINVLRTRELRLDGHGAGKTTVLVWFTEGGRATIDVEVNKPVNYQDNVANLIFEASVARAQGNYGLSRSLVKRLLGLDPANQAGIRLRDDLETQARETYLRAYAIRDSHPGEAKRMFREVMQLADMESELYLKAQSRYREFDKR